MISIAPRRLAFLRLFTERRTLFMVTAPSSVAVDVIDNTIKPQGLEPFNFQLSLADSRGRYTLMQNIFFPQEA